MARAWTGKWEGGRTRKGKDGTDVWVIEAMRSGTKYSISLKVHSLRDAMAELALFERDPVAYAAAQDSGPARDEVGDVPALTHSTLLRFLQAKRSGEDSVSREHLGDLARYLSNWLPLIRGKDLRKITLNEYRRHLADLGQPRKHIIALRSFTKWMRQEGALSSAQDASRDVAVPQPKARKGQMTLGYTMGDFERLYFNLRARPERRGDQRNNLGRVITEAGRRDAQTVRDILVLRALCGMHHTEVARLAVGGWKVTRVQGHGEIAGTAKFIHKNGGVHIQALCDKALAAAERLQARRWVPEKKFIHRYMDEACERAGLSKMRPGELRHSFVTWSKTYGRLVKPVEGMGVSLDAIARIIGHKKEKTTSTFYDNTEVPEMIALPLTLENPEDPVYNAPSAEVSHA